MSEVEWVKGTPASLTDFIRRVQLGQVKNHSLVKVKGDVAAIAAAPVVTPICSAGLWQTPTAAVSIEVSSSSANDTNSAGSGARAVKAIFLNSLWNIDDEEVNLNGVGLVPFTKQMRRLLGFRVSKAGTYANPNPVAGIGRGSNAGTITLQTVGGGANTIWATIPTNTPRGYGRSHIGAYCIPAGYRGWIWDAIPKIGVGGGYGLIINQHPEVIAAPFEPSIMEDLDRVIIDSASDYATMEGPFTGPCDLTWVAYSNSATPAASVRARILLEKLPT